MEKIVLAPKYYLDHFRTITGFVLSKYEALLLPHEKEFASKLLSLSEDAQLLYIRLVNRRGPYFRVNALKYDEIADRDQALAELAETQYISFVNTDKHHAIQAALSLFTKSEMVRCLQNQSGEIQKLSKIELAALLLAESEKATFGVTLEEPIILRNHDSLIELYRFLYFGNLADDHTLFVVNDLGHMKSEIFDDSVVTARFSNRKDLDDTLRVERLYSDFRHLRDENPAALYEWFYQHGLSFHELSPLAHPRLKRLVLRLGACLEKEKKWQEALEIYELTSEYPSRERRVQIFLKQKRLEDARQLVEEILLAPLTHEEEIFAQDRQAKLEKKGVKRTTQTLNEALVLSISYDYVHAVEEGVAQFYRSEGWAATHTENWIWSSLFGLIFWDLIFQPHANQIHSPFQRLPDDYFSSDFFHHRHDSLSTRLKDLDDREKWKKHLRNVMSEKYGLANAFVGWHESLQDILESLIDRIEVAQLASILITIAQDPRHRLVGFPDLYLFNETGCQFIEVKSPNDHLSSRQLFWLEKMRDLGVKTQIVRVEWDRRGFTSCLK